MSEGTVVALVISVLDMLIFAFRHQRLNLKSARSSILRGLCWQLDPIATGVPQWLAITDQMPGRASG